MLPLISTAPRSAPSGAQPGAQFHLRGPAGQQCDAWIEFDGLTVTGGAFGVHPRPVLEVDGPFAPLLWFLLGRLPLQYMAEALRIDGEIHYLPPMASSIELAASAIPLSMVRCVRLFSDYQQGLSAVDWDAWRSAVRSVLGMA